MKILTVICALKELLGEMSDIEAELAVGIADEQTVTVSVRELDPTHSRSRAVVLRLDIALIHIVNSALENTDCALLFEITLVLKRTVAVIFNILKAFGHLQSQSETGKNGGGTLLGYGLELGLDLNTSGRIDLIFQLDLGDSTLL